MSRSIIVPHAVAYTLTVFMIAGALLHGCAGFNPPPVNEASFRSRTVDQEDNGIRVSATVLDAIESETVFGLPLYKKGIQPVWLEVENKTEHRMWLAPVSIDPNYFSPLEVAYLHHSGYSKAARQQMDRHFHQYAIRGAVDPGDVRSGFVFTNLELGTKAFNVDVIGEDQQARSFTFLIPVAGLQVDHREVDWTGLYPERDLVDLENSRAFRSTIEELPCCATDKGGGRPADPINVVIIGRGEDLLYTLLRSGWDETAAASAYDPIAHMPWEFRYQPVKPLYLFNRSQDAAFRKSRSTLNERNQLRLWLSPHRFNGKNVWVGQISRIIRRSVWTPFVLEPDVDEARTYLLQDLWYAQSLLKYGYVRLSSISTLAQPRKGLHEDDYFTDGLCLVAWVSGEPVSLSEVQFEPWERPVLERRNLMLGRLPAKPGDVEAQDKTR
ncbi:MAG: LssY C-terminal domain-containing protein [Desulfobacterales bacterium]